MTNTIQFILGFGNSTAILGIALYLYMRDRKPKSYTFDAGYTEPSIMKAGAYAKKSDKRAPKVNDDSQAWKKENKLN